MASEVDITNALVLDLETLALPAHKVARYVEPRGLRGDQGTWLCVYPSGVDEDLITTQSSYENFHLFDIIWAVPVFLHTESNFGDETVAQSALNAAQLIGDQLRTYGEGIPDLPRVTATVKKIRYEIGDGFLWQAVFTLDVEAFH